MRRRAAVGGAGEPPSTGRTASAAVRCLGLGHRRGSTLGCDGRTRGWSRRTPLRRHRGGAPVPRTRGYRARSKPWSRFGDRATSDGMRGRAEASPVSQCTTLTRSASASSQRAMQPISSTRSARRGRFGSGLAGGRLGHAEPVEGRVGVERGAAHEHPVVHLGAEVAGPLDDDRAGVAQPLDVSLPSQGAGERLGPIAHVGGFLEPLGVGERRHLLAQRLEKDVGLGRDPLHGAFDDEPVGSFGDRARARTRRHAELGRCARRDALALARRRAAAAQRHRGLDRLDHALGRRCRRKRTDVARAVGARQCAQQRGAGTARSA